MPSSHTPLLSSSRLPPTPPPEPAPKRVCVELKRHQGVTIEDDYITSPEVEKVSNSRHQWMMSIADHQAEKVHLLVLLF